jgi:hypothetical protein
MIVRIHNDALEFVAEDSADKFEAIHDWQGPRVRIAIGDEIAEESLLDAIISAFRKDQP